MRMEMRKEVKTGEQVALGTLDGLEPQPTTEVVPPYQEPRNLRTLITGPLAPIKRGPRRQGATSRETGVAPDLHLE